MKWDETSSHKSAFFWVWVRSNSWCRVFLCLKTGLSSNLGPSFPTAAFWLQDEALPGLVFDLLLLQTTWVSFFTLSLLTVSTTVSCVCFRIYWLQKVLWDSTFFFLNIRGIFLENYSRNNSVCFKEWAISWHYSSVGLLMQGSCWWQQRWLFLPVELSRLFGEEKIYLIYWLESWFIDLGESVSHSVVPSSLQPRGM